MEQEEKEVLYVCGVVDPYNGKAPPFEKMFPGQEPDTGQIKDLTDQELEELGLDLSDKQTGPVFLYWNDDKFQAGEMTLKRFESRNEMLDFFKDKKYALYTGRINTNHPGIYIIRFYIFPENYDRELSKIKLDLRIKELQLKQNGDGTTTTDL